MLNAITLYRIAKSFYSYRIPFLPKFIRLLIFLVYNSVIPYNAKIGKNTKCAYGGIGVVIHQNSEIGENVYIGSNVTIGGKSGILQVPKIGNNVFIATGVKILGPVIIGDYVVIGANAVVTHDVPTGSVVAGIPAKIISVNGQELFKKSMMLN